MATSFVSSPSRSGSASEVIVLLRRAQSNNKPIPLPRTARLRSPAKRIENRSAGESNQVNVPLRIEIDPIADLHAIAPQISQITDSQRPSHYRTELQRERIHTLVVNRLHRIRSRSQTRRQRQPSQIQVA